MNVLSRDKVIKEYYRKCSVCEKEYEVKKENNFLPLGIMSCMCCKKDVCSYRPCSYNIKDIGSPNIFNLLCKECNDKLEKDEEYVKIEESIKKYADEVAPLFDKYVKEKADILKRVLGVKLK